MFSPAYQSAEAAFDQACLDYRAAERALKRSKSKKNVAAFAAAEAAHDAATKAFRAAAKAEDDAFAAAHKAQKKAASLPIQQLDLF